MDQILLYPIAIPFAAAVICILLPKRASMIREGVALLTTSVTVAISGYIFIQPDLRFTVAWLAFGPTLAVAFDLLSTFFSRLILVAIAIFALLLVLYSIKFMQGHARHGEYFAYLLAALGAAAGSVLANNLIVLLFFWELLGFFLFLSVTISGKTSIPSATKTLIIAGIGDLSILLGTTLIWLTAGTLTLSDLAAQPIALTGWLSTITFLLMLVGAFAKSGIMPLHSWIPAISTEAQPPVMSYFTALDKMIGIYLLARLTLQFFAMGEAMGVALMAVGAITLITGVLMAMIQHDYRRMLAFHNVSQVGYMVLGIGTGTPVGIIGGLFHMFNMVMLKSNLFLCGGSVQRQTGRTEFADLGGLARAMPWTFVCTFIASLGIAGVPPLNAFVSKWLIYQGVLDRGGALFPLFLVAAMFGSALTLASFMKLLYSTFWGDRPSDLRDVTESSPWMLIPMIVLALSTIGSGIFYALPVESLLKPILGAAGVQARLPGLWESGLAVMLLILSLLVGFMIYFLGRSQGVQETEVFLGGESIEPERYRVPGTQFYGPIKEMGGLQQLFALAERGAFDLYVYLTDLLKWIGREVYDYVDQALADIYQEIIPALLSIVGYVLRLFNGKLMLTYALWLLYAVSIVSVIALPANASVLAAARIVACAGMIGWAILALVETDLKRLLLLALTSQFGFVVLGLTVSPGAALSYLVTSGIALGVLLACAESFIRARRTSALDNMNDLAARMPGTFYLFLLAAFWLAGLPPFGNFFSKYLLGTAAEEISPFLVFAMTGTAILTLGYLLRPVRRFLTTSSQDAGRITAPH
jgi:formate hydrogenlyase subunit 3/multisubunit Na+/H+ antiporter MnhD subunit